MTNERNRRVSFRRAMGICGLLACTVATVLAWRALSGGKEYYPYLHWTPRDSTSVALDPQTEARIVAFCSDCHAMPRPEDFPRERWHTEVQRGYEFFSQSERNDLDPPPMQQVVEYFRSRAPQEVVFPRPEEAQIPLRVQFTREKVDLSQAAKAGPEIAHLRWTPLDPGGSPVLLACDLRFGYLAAVDFRPAQPKTRIVARLNHPCHVETCDLDGDRVIDLVVADLGSTRPSDHDRGRVVWLRGKKQTDIYEEVVIASGLGRVADARPADFDGDGDLDLVVAEFGHYRTGGIHLLENTAAPGQLPRFERRQLDDRPGTIHVPVYDFNGDGHADFVALVSQEWEHVDAFIGQPDGRFRPETLWAGPDLTFGSSGIELVDLDQDGDMDILYTNGDAWDNWYVSPSHGVQWLENLGDTQFRYRRLTDFVGAYRALAGDIDLDGDLDIVVVAWLPPPVLPRSLQAESLASILCLEQSEPGVFVRHTLEEGSPRYATVELADFDEDGDLDFAVGPGPYMAGSAQTDSWLSVWWNQANPGRKSPAAGP